MEQLVCAGCARHEMHLCVYDKHYFEIHTAVLRNLDTHMVMQNVCKRKHSFFSECKCMSIFN